jgi:hypothetical protein
MPDADVQEWYKRTDLPLYGLPESHRCLRMTGDSGRALVHDNADGTLQQTEFWLGLFHGDPLMADAPTLQVISAVRPGPDLDLLLTAEADRPHNQIDLELAQFIRSNVWIDGEPYEAHGIGAGDGWVLAADVDDIKLVVVGVRWPLEGIELRRIHDLGPYLNGRAKYEHRLL